MAIKTSEFLYGQKRRVYMVVIGASLLAVLFIWAFRDDAGIFITPFSKVIFRAFIALLTILLIALWRSKVIPGWWEWAFFFGAAIGLLSRLTELALLSDRLEPDRLGGLPNLLYWFPIIYLLAFLIFEDRRRMLAASISFFALTLLIGSVDSYLVWRTDGAAYVFLLLLPFYLANIAYILLLSVGVRTNEQYIRLRARAETLEGIANTDMLVQIPNRRGLENLIAKEVSRATRHKQPLSVIVFDLDNLKQVNDTFGHQAGDNLLKETARIVQDELRLSDLLGRWGGDEFLIIAPNTDSLQAGELAGRLQMAIISSHSDQAGYTVSFGVAELRPQESFESLLRRTDDALYKAKEGGKDKVVIA